MTLVQFKSLPDVTPKGEFGYGQIEQRNKFSVGDVIEIMKPDGRDIETTVLGLYDEKFKPVESAPHPKQLLYVELDKQLDKYDIIRANTIVTNVTLVQLIQINLFIGWIS